MDTGKIGVVVVDRHEVLRRGLGDMIAAVPEVGSWRCTGELDETVRRVDDDYATDVLILSLDARRSIGGDVGLLNGVRTIVLVPSERPADVEDATRLKADGYVMLAELTTDYLRTALLEVCEDRLRLPAAMTEHLLRGVRDAGPEPRFDHLSPRERDVLQLVVTGLANKEIATALGISIHGVKRHVSSILGKHNSPSRAHLVSTVLGQNSA